MIQIIEQSHEEKVEMYMKCTKKELAQMLIESNKQLDAVIKNCNIPVVRHSTLLIRLCSRFYTDEQNDELWNNPIEIEWLLNVPRICDFFDADSILELPSFDEGNLSWSVSIVDYEKIDGIITPIIEINGE